MIRVGGIGGKGDEEREDGGRRGRRRGGEI